MVALVNFQQKKCDNEFALRACEVVASAVDTAEFETKYHLRGREKGRLAPVDANV